MSDQIAVDIQNITYSYLSNFMLRRTVALKSLTLQVKAGEAFAFLGPNGAGKTTTIKCILNLIRPQVGQTFVFGNAARAIAARRVIGYLPEQPYFYDYLTVEETVQMYGLLAGLAPAELRTALPKVLEQVGIPERRNARMRSLSKGLTQRVALAQAIIASPRLLILDEPFSGLDPIGRKEFRDIFLQLKQQGTTLFMASHILSDVEFLCDRASITVKGECKRVVDLRDQRFQAPHRFELTMRSPSSAPSSGNSGEGFPAALAPLGAVTTPEVGLLKLTTNTRAGAEQALQLALAHRIEINSFEAVSPTLEEIFVEVAGKGPSVKPGATQ